MAGVTVLNFGRRELVSCPCGDVGLFYASLIPQDWLQRKDHLPATLCNCGKRYYSWRLGKEFEAKT